MTHRIGARLMSPTACEDLDDPDLRRLLLATLGAPPPPSRPPGLTLAVHTDEAPQPAVWSTTLHEQGGETAAAAALNTLVRNKAERVGPPPGRYGGSTLFHRADGDLAATLGLDGSSAVAAWVTTVISPEGGIAVVVPGEPAPAVLVAPTLLAAAASFSGPLIAALRHVNGLLDAMSAYGTTVEPDAPLDALPTRLLPSEVLPAKQDLVPLVVRWRPNGRRRGPVYPPLPSDHRFADRECVCGDPLADERCVQTVVLAPFTPTPGTIAAFQAGREHDALAVLTHHTCTALALYRAVSATREVVDKAAADLATVPAPLRGRELPLEQVTTLAPSRLQALLTVAFEIEAHSHDTAFDGRPIQVFLLNVPDGPTATPADSPTQADDIRYSAMLLGGQGYHHEILEDLAIGLQQADVDSTSRLVTPGRRHLAVASDFELWMFQGSVEEYESQWAPRSPEDIPGSVRMHVLMLVDGQYTILVRRPGGGEPLAQVWPTGRQRGDSARMESVMLRLHGIITGLGATPKGSAGAE